MAPTLRPSSQGLANYKLFAQRASLRYELRHTSTAWGFLQSATRAVPHLVFKAPSRSSAQSSDDVQAWRIWRDISGTLHASAQEIPDSSSTAVALILKGPGEGAHKKEVVCISPRSKAAHISINNEEIEAGKLRTLCPDDTVRIDGNEYVYRDLVNVGDYPTHRERYDIGLSIGRGAEGFVDLATCITTGRMVAIKTVQMDFKTFNKHANEVRLWEGLHHPNVNEMVDWYRDPEKPTLLCTVSLLAGHQSLYHYVARWGRLPEKNAKPVVAQVIEGLMYIHSEGFLHRDIKAENILVFHKDDSGVLTVKISDFGTCIPIDKNPDAIVDHAGSGNWAAPEVAFGRNNEISEAFCVGGVMFFCLYRRRPFHVQEGATDIVAQITTRQSQLAIIGNEDEDDEISEEDDDNKRPGGDARRLLRGLLKEDPDERWDLMTAKASPWLQGCTIPKGRVTPLAPNHPLAHNLVAYIHCRALDPASIPEQYQPGQQPAPVEEVTPQIQPGAADNYTRGSTESLSTHALSSVTLRIQESMRSATPPATPGPTAAAPNDVRRHRSIHRRSLSPLPGPSAYEIPSGGSPAPALGSAQNAGPSRLAREHESTEPLFTPVVEDVEHVEIVPVSVSKAVFEHVPVPTLDAAMDVDRVPGAAEELGFAGADILPAAVTLHAAPRPTGTRTRARAGKGVSSSSPKPPVRRSARIRDQCAGIVGGKTAAPRGAQAASGGKVKVATGEKRKLGARVEKISKKRKTD